MWDEVKASAADVEQETRPIKRDAKGQRQRSSYHSHWIRDLRGVYFENTQGMQGSNLRREKAEVQTDELVSIKTPSKDF